MHTIIHKDQAHKQRLGTHAQTRHTHRPDTCTDQEHTQDTRQEQRPDTHNFQTHTQKRHTHTDQKHTCTKTRKTCSYKNTDHKHTHNYTSI